MNIIITGCKNFGKGTFCKELALQDPNFQSISSSQLACNEFIFENIKDKYGYNSINECYLDRVNRRQEWYELIRDFNTPDKTKLAKLLFSKFKVYDGIRDLEELNAIREAKLVDLVVWIDRGRVCPTEDITSMDITAEHCDIIIDNNGPEEHIPYLVKDFLNKLPAYFMQFIEKNKGPFPNLNLLDTDKLPDIRTDDLLTASKLFPNGGNEQDLLLAKNALRKVLDKKSEERDFSRFPPAFIKPKKEEKEISIEQFNTMSVQERNTYLFNEITRIGKLVDRLYHKNQ